MTKKDDTARSRARRYAEVEALKAAPCMDCGGTFPPECMDFDHVWGTKSLAVGVALQTRSMAFVRAEIAKCDLVCSNCHRIRTKKRKSRRDPADAQTLRKPGPKKGRNG